MEAFVGLDAEMHIGLVLLERGIVPGVAVFIVLHIEAEDRLEHLEGVGHQSLGEIAPRSQDKVVSFDIVVVQVPGSHRMHHAVMNVRTHDLVSHQVSAPQQLVTLLEKNLGAEAGNRRRQRARKYDAGGNALADAAGNRHVLQAEHLRQHHGVLVLKQHAHLLHHLLPHAVHGAGNLDRTHFAGALLQFLHLRQVEETHPAAHALLLQAVGQEGREEVVVAEEVHDKDLPGKLGRREDVDVFQREGRFPESAQRHQAHAGAVVKPHAGLGEEVHDALLGLLKGFKAAREKMQGILPGADNGGFLSCFLQGDAGYHAGQAATYDDSIEFHRPSTCL